MDERKVCDKRNSDKINDDFILRVPLQLWASYLIAYYMTIQKS